MSDFPSDIYTEPRDIDLNTQRYSGWKLNEHLQTDQPAPAPAPAPER